MCGISRIRAATAEEAGFEHFELDQSLGKYMRNQVCIVVTSIKMARRAHSSFSLVTSLLRFEQLLQREGSMETLKFCATTSSTNPWWIRR